MDLRPIERENWQVYLDELSKAIQGNYVEIEIAGVGLGDQVEEAWVPLIGLSYDPKEDIMFVHMDECERIIHEPKELVALFDRNDRVNSLVIKDSQGNVNTVKFRAPVLLESGRRTGVDATTSPTP